MIKHGMLHQIRWHLTLSWIVLLTILTFYFFPSFTGVYEEKDGSLYAITLPHTEELPGSKGEPRRASYRITMDWQPHEVGVFEYFSNSCLRTLTVNETTNVPLPPCRNWKITLDLRPFLKPGENILDLGIGKSYYQKHEGWYDEFLLDFRAQIFGSFASSTLMFLWLATLILLATLTLRALRFDPVTVTAVALFTCLTGIQMSANGYYMFEHDFIGHLDYVQYMHTHWWRDDPYGHNIFRHPPLYYMVASAVTRTLGNWWAMGGIALRALSFLLYIAFLLFGLLTIRRLAESRMIYRMASLAFIAWPLGVIVAVRISNDIALYAAYAAAVYCLVRWYQSRTGTDFWLAVAAASVTLMVKYNALMLFACLGLLMLDEIRQRNLFKAPRPLIAAALMLAVFSLSSGPLYSAWLHAQQPHDSGILGDMIFTSGPTLLRNEPEQILTFSMERYLTYPFTYMTGSNSNTIDRENFWEYLLKTSLYGESRWDYRLLASLILFLAAMNVALTAAGTALMGRAEIRKLSCEALLLIVPVLGLLYFRWVYEQASAQNFRYIYPVIIPFALWWAKTYAFLEKDDRPVLQYALLGFGTGAITLLHVFFLLHFLPGIL